MNTAKNIVGLVLLVVLSLSGCAGEPTPEPLTTSATPTRGVTTSDPDGLELVLTLDKAVYGLNEPITATIVLTNKSAQPILVQGRLAVNWDGAPSDHRDLCLVILNPQGEKAWFEPLINMGSAQDKHFVTLAPGKSLERIFPVLGAYTLDEVGEYTIQAVYQNQRDPSTGQQAWKGELKSNPIHFTINP